MIEYYGVIEVALSRRNVKTLQMEVLLILFD